MAKELNNFPAFHGGWTSQSAKERTDNPLSLNKITTLDDGSVVIETAVETRRVRGPDGTFRTLYSYDGGSTWGMNPRRLISRMKKGERLHPGYIDRITEPARTGSSASVPTPMLMEVEHHGEVRSRDRAKRPRNIKSPNVRQYRPVHRHWCHGVQFVCCCDAPSFRRKCGTTGCLYNNILPDMIGKLSKLHESRRIK